LNARTVLLGLFVALTIALASTTVYESGIRTTITSTSTSTVTAISESTITTTSVEDLTTTSFVDPNLTSAYLSHIAAIASANLTALEAQFETNATLNVMPNNFQNKGWDGIGNITSFYQGDLGEGCPPCFGLVYPFSVANETYSITMSNDLKAAHVTSHLIFYGTGGPNPSGSVYTDDMRFDISYVLQGQHWLISTEILTSLGGGTCTQKVVSPDGSVFTCLNYPS
jgi:hypothetical protein